MNNVALFGKKKQPEQEQQMPGTGTPTNLVMQMRQQGLSDNQIVQSLQNEGYSSVKIRQAFQARKKQNHYWEKRIREQAIVENKKPG